MGGLFISASGIMNATRRIEVTANNVANMRTPGFRAGRAESVETQGGGVTLGAVSRSNAQGPIETTGRPLDAAPGQDAFFRVRLADGSAAFTRDGHFSLDAQGRMVTAHGALVDPPIQVPRNATQVSVTSGGAVFATLPGQAEPVQLSPLEVFLFPNMGGLEALGQNLFRSTGASGEALPVLGPGAVTPGAIEGSNVDPATEQVNLLLDRHAFQANLAAFRAQDEVLGDLLQLEQ